MSPPVRFAVIGIDHVHAFSMTSSLLREGAVATAHHGGSLAEAFARAHPSIAAAESVDAILSDGATQLVVIAAVPCERAALAERAMRAGKDVLVDKPGATTLEQLASLRAVCAETGRRWGVYFSERLESAATVRALELAGAGAIGRVLHVEMQGPHRLGLVPRPDWFFDPARSGGVLADLASHAADQMLCATGEVEVEIAAAQVACFASAERPGFEDFGAVLFRGTHASGYARVDWYTPAGLASWGDVRLFLVGSEGTIEVRKNVDPAGRDGDGHLFLVDRDGARYERVTGTTPFAANLLRDLRGGGDEALSNQHCLRATELALRAQAAATRIHVSRRRDP
jgi:predicted dehydrogenase